MTMSTVQLPCATGPAKRTVGGGRRRARTNYTPEQLSGLEELFAKTQYPGIDEREALADAVQLSEARVQVWFQNRRARLRRKDSVGASPTTTTRVKKAKPSSRPSTSSSPRSSPTSSASPPSTSLASVSPPTLSPHRYLEVCTQACCVPSTPHHTASRPHYFHQSGAQFLTGASKGYYPWSPATLGAFQQGVAPGYPYAYLYPGASPFYYDYTLPVPATTSYPAVSIQEVVSGLHSSAVVSGEPTSV